MSQARFNQIAVWVLTALLMACCLVIAFLLGQRSAGNKMDQQPAKSASDVTQANHSGREASETGSQETKPPRKVRYDYSRLTPRTQLEGAGNLLETLAFSPDGRYLAAGGGKSSGGGDTPYPYIETGEIIVWNVRSFNVHCTIRIPEFSVSSIAFSPDSASIAGTGSGAGSTQGAGYTQLWDVNSSAERFRIPIEAGYVTFDPTGRFIATRGVICDARNGRVIHKLLCSGRAVFSSDGKLLFHGGGAFNTDTGKVVLSFDSRDPTHNFAFGGCLACSNDGSMVACGYRLRRLPQGQPIDTSETFKVDGNKPLCVAFSPDSRALALGFGRGSTGVWDTASLARIALIRPSGSNETAGWMVRSVSFSPDGKLIAAALYNGRVAIWEAAERENPD